MAVLFKVFRDAADVITPRVLAISFEAIEVKLHAILEIKRPQPNSALGAAPAREPDIAIDSRRQDEALVVIGVLTNQVDAPGCSSYRFRGRAEQSLKGVFDMPDPREGRT